MRPVALNTLSDSKAKVLAMHADAHQNNFAKNASFAFASTSQAGPLVTDALGVQVGAALQKSFQHESVSDSWIHFVAGSLVVILVKCAVWLWARCCSPNVGGSLPRDSRPAKAGATAGAELLLAPSAQEPREEVPSEETLRDRWSGRLLREPLPDKRLEDFIADGPAEKVAIMTSSGRCITYQQLRERSGILGAGIREQCGAGWAACGLFAEKGERGDELIYAIFGILKAGCAYVPLPPSFPSGRIQYIAEDARLAVVVTTGTLKATWDRDFGSVNVPVLDAGVVLEAGLRTCGGSSIQPGLASMRSPDDVAVMLYTSGSTGKPKGVSLTHRAEATAITYYADEFLRETDRAYFCCAYNFDVSIWDIFSTFAKGATMVIGPTSGTDVAGMQRVFECLAPTVSTFVPSVFTVYTGSFGIPPSLERASFIGEALSVQNWASMWSSGKQAFNLYGPTECSVSATSLIHSLPGVEQCPSVPIGGPHRWREAYVMSQPDDESGPLRAPEMVGFGEQGELWLGGPGLAEGYVNLPDKTASAFVKHPFSENERAYRTGDLCKWLDSGVIQFLGRIDTQVKLHGLRIELEEIENVLRSDPSVVEAVVVVQQQEGGGANGQRLVAWLSPPGAAAANAVEACQKALPKYMVPSIVKALAEWPRNAAGKIDRLTLAKWADELEMSETPEGDSMVTVVDSMATLRRMSKSSLGFAQHVQSILGFATMFMVLDHFTDFALHDGGGGIEGYRRVYYKPLLYFDGMQMAGFVIVVGLLNTMSCDLKGVSDAVRLTWNDFGLVVIYVVWGFPVPEILAAFLYIGTGSANYLPWTAAFGRSSSVRWFCLYLFGGKLWSSSARTLWPSIQYLVPLVAALALETQPHGIGVPTVDGLPAYVANVIFVTHWGLPALRRVHKCRDVFVGRLAALCAFHLAGWVVLWLIVYFADLRVGTWSGLLLFPVQMVAVMVAIPDFAAFRFVSKYIVGIFLSHRMIYPVAVAGGVRLFGFLPIPGSYSAAACILSQFDLYYKGANLGLCTAISCLVQCSYVAGFIAFVGIPFHLWLVSSVFPLAQLLTYVVGHATDLWAALTDWTSFSRVSTQQAKDMK